jgi:hypothetical protein
LGRGWILPTRKSDLILFLSWAEGELLTRKSDLILFLSWAEGELPTRDSPYRRYLCGRGGGENVILTIVMFYANITIKRALSWLSFKKVQHLSVFYLAVKKMLSKYIKIRD